MIRTLAAVLATSTCIVALATPAAAQTREYNIRAGSLKSALDAYVRQSGRQVVYRADEVRAARSPGVRGSHSAEAALANLLAGSGFTTRIDGALIAIVKAGNVTTASQLPGEGVAGNAAANGESTNEIVVTGTNIRGQAPAGSPVQSYNRKQIEQTGAATIQQFLQTVPANFGGGANEGLPAGNPGDANSAQNLGSGSGVNLRGLGSKSTLVLLNGRRLAPSSGIGDFVDVSMIPLDAVERVELLTDGASSIYGGDAVAGVANFVLRKDYEGHQTSLRYGGSSDGGAEEVRFNHLSGFNWASGGVLLSYEYFDRARLGAEERSFSRGAALPNALLPSQRRHSVVLSGHQGLAPGVRLTADALYSERVSENAFTIGTTTQSDRSKTGQLSASGGIEADLGGDWFADAVLGYDNVHLDRVRRGVNTAELRVRSTQLSFDAKASGSLFDLPGGSVRLALGGHYRDEDFSNSNVTTGRVSRRADRHVAALFGELSIPLIGKANALGLFQELRVSASGRYERYNDFGSTFNPKIGLLWSPVTGLSFRGNYGTSFTAPPLGQVGALDTNIGAYTNNLINTFFAFPVEVPSAAVQVIAFGTSKNLKPEKSKNFSAGLDANAHLGGSRLSVSATYFDIAFRDRIDTPVISGGAFNAINLYLQNPANLPSGLVAANPTSAQVAALVAIAQQEAGFSDSFGVYQGPGNVGYIVNFLTGNNARTDVRGVDLSATLDSPMAGGTLTTSAALSYLINLKKQTTSTSPTIDVVNTIYNPPHFRGRFGETWSDGRWSASLFANHVGGYRDDRNGGRVKDWTTFDLSLAFESGEAERGSLLSGLKVQLSALNLFNRAPPTVASNANFLLFAYDASNANPLKRFLSLQVTKRW